MVVKHGLPLWFFAFFTFIEIHEFTYGDTIKEFKFAFDVM